MLTHIHICFKRPPKDIYNFPGVLNCYEYRTFWVSWEDNVIKVGRGAPYGLQYVFTMDTHVYLAYRDCDCNSSSRLVEYAIPEEEPGSVFPINYVAFQTGWGAFGYWGISTDLSQLST